MVLGVCRLQLILPEAHSLKEKRAVVQSLLAQLRRKFNVAISEVEDQDRWKVAGQGFCVVSADGRHADRMMAEIMDFLEGRVNAEGGAQLGGYETELIHAL